MCDVNLCHTRRTFRGLQMLWAGDSFALDAINGRIVSSLAAESHITTS